MFWSVALAVVLAFSFVLQMQPVHEIAEANLAPLVPRKCWPLTRVLLVALVSGLARAVPDMRRMVALTGAVSFAAIGFVGTGLIGKVTVKQVGAHAPALLADSGLDLRIAACADSKHMILAAGADGNAKDNYEMTPIDRLSSNSVAGNQVLRQALGLPDVIDPNPVSYTHLTLPTILLV